MDIVSGAQILNTEGALRKLRRMAFEIAEQHTANEALTIAGIQGHGVLLANHIAEAVRAILQIPIETAMISLDKLAPQKATIDLQKNWNNQSLLVVDDVSNTGKTLLYALRPFLDFAPKKIQTLVLVERSHKLFSIQPDYVGLSVSTTLQEHISVRVEKGVVLGAWLH